MVGPLILTVIASLVLLIWTSRHVMLWREKRTGFTLTPKYSGPPEDAPYVSVLVAAKDEAENIGTCVRTMLGQDYPRFDLTVCNDRSNDATPDIVDAIAQDDPRLHLINIDHLPEGWGGKNHAMQHGANAAQGEWLCLIDADCRQVSPRTLATAMQYAQDTGADLLSVLPTLEMKGFWENVVQPVCGGVMIIWFHPDKVNSPRYPNAYANGAFMLIKRSAYDAIGGHEAFRTCVNEDMHMAAGIKRAGLRLRVVRNSGLYLCRMYTSLQQIVRGWSRIFYGTFVTGKRIGVSLAVLSVVSLGPYLLAPLGLGLWAGGVGHAKAWLAMGLAGLGAAAMQLSVMFRFYKLIGARRSLFWTYPIGAAVAFYCLILSLLKLRKGSKLVWRNTSYVGMKQGS